MIYSNIFAGETIPSPYPPSEAQQLPGQTPLGPPPAYPSFNPISSHLPMQHALLQQQLLQNPHFAQANANNNHTGK